MHRHRQVVLRNRSLRRGLQRKRNRSNLSRNLKLRLRLRQRCAISNEIVAHDIEFTVEQSALRAF